MARVEDPQISFADIELRSQAVKLDETLQAISELLDREAHLVEAVYQDLTRGLKSPRRGRKGMTAAQVLRAFILRRVKSWDLRELRERISDGVSLRIFTTFNTQPVPSHQAFSQAFNRLTPATVRSLNTFVLQLADELGLLGQNSLRLDTTVVETDIHFPTDAGLLWDAVRVITRDAKRICEELPELPMALPDRTRRARRRLHEINRMTPAQRRRQQRCKYRDLIRVTEEVMEKGTQLATLAKETPVPDLVKAIRINILVHTIEHYCDLAQKVVHQTRRRVLQGEKVPPEDKIVSIFEPHTDIIVRGKANTPVEFGHKILLVERKGGLITDYAVLKGNPSDEGHVAPVLERHRSSFGAAPRLFAGDRGFYSAANLQVCRDAGVKVECIPQRGGHKTPEREAYENSRAFRRGQRFRAGVEGRISVLLRGRGMRRCLNQGLERFEVFVGAAVLANNLLLLASLVKTSQPRRRRIRAA